MKVRGYAAASPKAKLAPWEFERRDLGTHDVALDIKYSGICHSDIHQAREEWGPAMFPMVPGHEIAGVVSSVGSAVTKFKVGDLIGVGVFVDDAFNQRAQSRRRRVGRGSDFSQGASGARPDFGG